MYFYIVFYYFDFVWYLYVTFMLFRLFYVWFLILRLFTFCSEKFVRVLIYFPKGISGILYCVREGSFIGKFVCWVVSMWCVVLSFINSGR